jgi:hypothetical protein
MNPTDTPAPAAAASMRTHILNARHRMFEGVNT